MSENLRGAIALDPPGSPRREVVRIRSGDNGEIRLPPTTRREFISIRTGDGRVVEVPLTIALLVELETNIAQLERGVLYA